MPNGRLDFKGNAMRRGTKLKPIVLTVEENERLLEWTRRHSTAQALALRARIVLACQHDGSNREIDQQLRVTTQTVGKWSIRFQRPRLDGLRLDGLLDEPRPRGPSHHQRCSSRARDR